MIRTLSLFAISLIITTQALSQNQYYNNENNFTIAFYNVENLFDTINDPNKIDEQFLPESDHKWNSERYNKKLNDLGRVISSININELPEIVGLCEIENKTVLTDLVNNKFLLKGNYAIAHEESPDKRGIDVALLYNKNEFHYLNHKTYQIHYDFEPEITTRDILYVSGKLNNGEKLHVFVNHWSSRRGGQEKSEPKRLYAAKVLRLKVDSILKTDKEAKIVIVGDFNDESTNKSLHKVLNATNNQRTTDYLELYNLMFDKSVNGLGTYNFRGNWNMLDNIIVSQNLLKNNKGYMISTDGGQIFKKRWMMYDNVKTGQMTPARTYGGPNYYGGISDHFPVYLILKK